MCRLPNLICAAEFPHVIGALAAGRNGQFLDSRGAMARVYPCRVLQGLFACAAITARLGVYHEPKPATPLNRVPRGPMVLRTAGLRREQTDPHHS